MTSTDTSMFFNVLLFLGSMTNGIALATGIFLILRAFEFFVDILPHLGFA